MEEKQIDKEGMLPVGTTLSNGKYQVEKHLSSGGFGNTYVAIDTAFDERVAIKELYIKGVCGRESDSANISISLTENQRTFTAQQEKFKKEARRLRKLVNPHIIRVHDLFDENGTSYYVMDLVDGESLSQRMKRTGKPMTEQELMLILPQVLDALETVHAEGIHHLDLKPANIMLDRKGNALLIDFGASKQLRNSDGNSLSTSSALAYTPGYAPSEQMEQNIEKFGPWTDLYALGATMYNLLTRNQPPSPSDIDEDAEAALPMPATLSKKTRDLILWLMKPNRKMRPQSVADVKQFLVEVPTRQPQAEKPKEAPKPSDEKADTLLKGGKSKGSVPSSDSKKKGGESGGSKKGMTYLVAVIAVVLIGGGVAALSQSRCGGRSERAGLDTLDTTAVDTMATYVTDKKIAVENGPENMRTYTYTGEVDAEGLPQGEGKAQFAAYGNIPAATYEGHFVDGICTGQGKLVFTSGDSFEGILDGGFYKEGTYRLSDGSYFQGTFKSGSPWSGTWYNASGQKDGEVKNGKEQ